MSDVGKQTKQTKETLGESTWVAGPRSLHSAWLLPEKGGEKRARQEE